LRWSPSCAHPAMTSSSMPPFALLGGASAPVEKAYAPLLHVCAAARGAAQHTSSATSSSAAGLRARTAAARRAMARRGPAGHVARGGVRRRAARRGAAGPVQRRSADSLGRTHDIFSRRNVLKAY
jgi:hypothetical protein